MATREVAIIILRKTIECLTEVLAVIELQNLFVKTEETPVQASTPGFSTPPTTNASQTPEEPYRPPKDENPENFPIYLFNWLDQYPGTVHRHQKEAFVGTCPTCVHVKNLGKQGKICTHDCHNEKHPKITNCPWCFRKATTDPQL